MSSMAGELVTEVFDFDGGREVTVYVPPDRPRRSRSPATVRCSRIGAKSVSRRTCRPR
jgi:hypothetical protein